MPSLSWPDASFERVFTAAIGATPGGGSDKTVMVVFKPNDGRFGLLSARLGTTLVWAMFQDGSGVGQMFFGTGDFHGGPVPVAGEWLQAAARFTGSTHNVNWRSRTSTGGGAAWAAWANILDYATAEGGTTIDNLLLGHVFGDLADGLYAAVGIWGSKLSDGQIDALGVDMNLWQASGATVYQLNAVSSPPVGADIVDITGHGANGTAYSTASGNVTLSLLEPPGIVYWPAAPTNNPAAFLPFFTP